MDPVVIISLLLNAIAVILVVWLVYRGDKTISQFNPHVSEITKMKEDLLLESKKAMDQSLELARQIVKTTQENATKNLEISNTFLKELHEDVRNKMSQTISESRLNIQNTSGEVVQEYQRAIRDLAAAQEKVLRDSQAQVIEATRAKIDEIGRILPDQVLNLHQGLDQKIQEKLAQADKEIETYKQEQFKEVQEKIYRVIGEISKKTIGRSIDVSTHEELVMNALEKARKDKVI